MTFKELTKILSFRTRKAWKDEYWNYTVLYRRGDGNLTLRGEFEINEEAKTITIS